MRRPLAAVSQIADGNVVDSVVQGNVFSREAVHYETSNKAC
ncbi:MULTISPECIES: hypothetical protein [unclassified Knoellia]